MNRTDVQFAHRRWVILLRSPGFWAIVAAATVISAPAVWRDEPTLTAGMGAFAESALVSVFSSITASFAILLGLRLLPGTWGVMLRYAMAGLLAAPFVTLSVLATVTVLEWHVMPMHDALRLLLDVTVTTVTISFAVAVFAKPATPRSPTPPDRPPDRLQDGQPGRQPDGPEIPQAPFLRRLPAELGHALVRLSASDHYVEAYTQLGHSLILLRFSDALKELDGLDGLQIHRSHWVARSGMQHLRKDGRNLFVVLKDGSELPVSRSRKDEVSALGLPER